MKMNETPASARRHPPPPPSRCSDGSYSNMLGKEERSASMIGYSKPRTRPYYSRRCKRVRPTNIEFLPDELLLDILARLPGNCLHDRARVVCRRWYHIIHSRAFINTHLQHSRYGLLFSRRSIEGGHPIFMAATHSGLIETSEFSYECRTRFLGSCNGLVMEVKANASVSPTIINPATKQAFALPSYSGRAYGRSCCVIAYAAASMEYKVVLPHMGVGPGLAIFTVGVDSSWREVRVEHLCLVDVALARFSPVTTEGFVHWMTERHEGKVLTLDVESEILSLSKIPFPRFHDRLHSKYCLSTGRSLSVLISLGNYKWELWEMKPETKEWTRLATEIKFGAKKGSELLVPMGWVKFPEVLALGSYDGNHKKNIIFYNLDTHEIINSTQLPFCCGDYRVFLYKNTLEWLS